MNETREAHRARVRDFAENAANVAFPIFQLFGWEWGSKAAGQNHVPTRADIEASILGKCKMALEEARKRSEGFCRISGGRLHVTCDLNEGSTPVYEASLDIGVTMLHLEEVQ